MPKNLVISSGAGVLTDNTSLETKNGIQQIKDGGVSTLKTKFEAKAVYSSMIFRDPGSTVFTPYLAYYRDIQYSPEIDAFYAVGEADNWFADRSFSISYNNGETWTHTQMPYYMAGIFDYRKLNWTSIIRSPQTGVMVATSPDFGMGFNIAYSSNNGATWGTSAISASIQSVCWSPELGLFCASVNAVSSSPVTSFYTSSNGSSWNQRLAIGKSWGSICWSPQLGLFCAVGSGYVATSSNGIAWTVTSVPGMLPTRVVWSPELGIFCAKGFGKFFVSSDGINWTSKVISGAAFLSCWSSDLMAFVGFSGSNIFTSSNGLDWNLVSIIGGGTAAIAQSSKTGAFLSVNGNTIRKFL